MFMARNPTASHSAALMRLQDLIRVRYRNLSGGEVLRLKLELKTNRHVEDPDQNDSTAS